MTNVQAQIGVGVHPWDSSVPTDGSYQNEAPVPLDSGAGASQSSRREPYTVANEDAIGVFQRASHDWSANTVVISQTTKILGRQKGRTLVTLFVPNTATEGVVLAPTQGEADMANGITLEVGSTIDLATEGSIYAGLITGKTTGTVAYIALTNPVGS